MRKVYAVYTIHACFVAGISNEPNKHRFTLSDMSQTGLCPTAKFSGETDEFCLVGWLCLACS